MSGWIKMVLFETEGKREKADLETKVMSYFGMHLRCMWGLDRGKIKY